MVKITEKNDSIAIEFHIKPNSKITKLSKDTDSFTLFIASPPVKGKANRVIIQYLSRLFGVMKSQITIISGVKSDTKVILFSGLGFEKKQQFYSILKI